MQNTGLHLNLKSRLHDTLFGFALWFHARIQNINRATLRDINHKYRKALDDKCRIINHIPLSSNGLNS